MRICKSELQSLLDDRVKQRHVPGASVGIYFDGELITASSGVTNVTTGVDVTPDTVMHIGSITKVINATLVMQLVDAGLVDLDELVVRYLPDLQLKNQQAQDQVTVRMLLCHTSGIDGELFPDRGHDEETIEGAVRALAGADQLFAPGREFSYCNAATVTAGYLAQRLVGRSWYELIKERIFAPLELRHAAVLPEEALLHRASVGHYLVGGKLNRTSFAFLPLSYAPAGTTLMMSATDLVSFARAHLAMGVGANGARILCEATAHAMQTIAVNNVGSGYAHLDMGIGWMVAGDGLLTHAGGGPGIVSLLCAHPRSGLVMAVLTNAAHGLSLIHDILRPFLEELSAVNALGLVCAPAPAEHVEIDPRIYVGVYEDVLTRLRVSQCTNGLMLSLQAKFAYYENVSTEPTDPSRLIPLGDHGFLLESEQPEYHRRVDANRIYTFRNRDAAGRAQHIGNGMRLYSRVMQ